LYDQLQHHPDFWMPPIKEIHYFDGQRAKTLRAKVLYQLATADLPGTNRERAANSDRPLEPRDLEFLAAFVRLAETREPGVSNRLLMAASSLASRFVPGYSSVHRDVIYPTLRVRGQPDFQMYTHLFGWKGPALSGDITPGYSTLTSGTVRRIVEAFPGLKVMFIARDPVERFWSVGNRKGQGLPVDARALERRLRKASHANRSYQTQIVTRWRQLVPAKDFGLFLFDDLVADAAGFRRRVLSFLGGDPDKPSGDLPPGFNRKSSRLKRPLSAAFRQLLAQWMADELRESAREFGGSATAWPKKYGL
jgi:hypothetical protein